MNIIKFLRKPYLAILLASLTLFSSCSQYDNDLTESIDAVTLKNIQKTIQFDLSNSKITATQSKSTEEAQAEALYLENVKYLNNHTFEELFVKNNVDTEIISELEFYENNVDNENVYQELINNFNIDSEQEANVLFSIIEVRKLVEQEIENSSKTTISKSQMQKISWGCALAIAGTAGATIGFIGVTGGTGLLYALAMKGIATAALIEACGDGWGDI